MQYAPDGGNCLQNLVQNFPFLFNELEEFVGATGLTYREVHPFGEI
jgi:hypothetical protein